MFSSLIILLFSILSASTDIFLHFFTQALQATHLSISYSGRQVPIIPKSCILAFIQSLGQPVKATLKCKSLGNIAFSILLANSVVLYCALGQTLFPIQAETFLVPAAG